jgi:hypothetical protein
VDLGATKSKIEPMQIDAGLQKKLNEMRQRRRARAAKKQANERRKVGHAGLATVCPSHPSPSPLNGAGPCTSFMYMCVWVSVCRGGGSSVLLRAADTVCLCLCVCVCVCVCVCKRGWALVFSGPADFFGHLRL